jgi:peptidoglycan/LPS O-acetylase OafA/YrhL
MTTATSTKQIAPTIDNTDWLKFFAIVLVSIDHIGFFLIEDADWWSVYGHLAAPVFFFLVGFSQTRSVPFSWIWLGIILTLFESWNNDSTWVTPNILLNLALIRILQPHLQKVLSKYGWIAFVLIISAILAMLPIAAHMVDYGAEGWLWALFGLCQSMYVKSASIKAAPKEENIPKLSPDGTAGAGLMRLLACLLATSIYLWQEQLEFDFSQTHLASCVLFVSVLSLILMYFRRGSSCIQPPEPIAQVLHFTGRHTLEIYAIQLGGFELIVNFFPDFVF